MGLKKVLGITFTGYEELALLLFQLACYANSYYVTVFLLGPLPFTLILLLTLTNFLALAALYQTNSTHQLTAPKSPSSQHCRRCASWIFKRDHHCIFTGRCVQKANYPSFLSYVFYSYMLSCYLLYALIREYELFLEILHLPVKYSLPLAAAAISGAYFLIFTGGLLAGSLRSIIIGVYTVDEIKKRAPIKYTAGQIRKMWFSSAGRATILGDFRRNWPEMVGEDVSFKQILLVV